MYPNSRSFEKGSAGFDLCLHLIPSGYVPALIENLSIIGQGCPLALVFDGYRFGLLPRSNVVALPLGVVGIVLNPAMTARCASPTKEYKVRPRPWTTLRSFLAMVDAATGITATLTEPSGSFSDAYEPDPSLTGH